MTTMNIPGLLTVADAANALDRSTEQVRRYLREGRLKGRRFGGQWFIEDKALSSFRQSLTESRFLARPPATSRRTERAR